MSESVKHLEPSLQAVSSEMLLAADKPVSREAAGMVTETCNLMLARFDMMKQSLWDEDSSTCFYSEKLMQVPKKMKYIPIEDNKVHTALTSGLD